MAPPIPELLPVPVLVPVPVFVPVPVLSPVEPVLDPGLRIVPFIDKDSFQQSPWKA